MTIKVEGPKVRYAESSCLGTKINELFAIDCNIIVTNESIPSFLEGLERRFGVPLHGAIRQAASSSKSMTLWVHLGEKGLGNIGLDIKIMKPGLQVIFREERLKNWKDAIRSFESLVNVLLSFK